MTVLNPLTAFTDYPFVELGDVPRTHAPVREVLLIKWDGDKYATIFVEGRLLTVKAGYLYKDRGLVTGWPTSEIPL